jgi:hypothetical protein
MWFTSDREQIRSLFYQSWRKYRSSQPLEPLEAVIAEVLAAHPEYHPLFENDRALSRDFSPEMGEGNPFLHLALHVAIREQLGTDRPKGILSLYAGLMAEGKGEHDVEHRMMECLAEGLWEAMRSGVEPDERRYLKCVRGRMRKTRR